MKSKMKIKMKIAGKLWGLSAILLFVSWAKGFDDNESFSSGVSNTQLLSPAEDGITISKSADEKTFTVKLPSKSVIEPLPVPFTRTLTPIIGSPDTASFTCPFQ